MKTCEIKNFDSIPKWRKEIHEMISGKYTIQLKEKIFENSLKNRQFSGGWVWTKRRELHEKFIHGAIVYTTILTQRKTIKISYFIRFKKTAIKKHHAWQIFFYSYLYFIICNFIRIFYVHFNTLFLCSRKRQIYYDYKYVSMSEIFQKLPTMRGTHSKIVFKNVLNYSCLLSMMVSWLKHVNLKILDSCYEKCLFIVMFSKNSCFSQIDENMLGANILGIFLVFGFRSNLNQFRCQR